MTLSEPQQRVLDFVRHAIHENGMPPTRREIADAFGYASPNAAEDLLKSLEKAGAVKLIRNISRGIRVL